jgi:hypothetical protein
VIVQIYKPRKQAGRGESMDQPTARLCRRGLPGAPAPADGQALTFARER